MHRKKRTKASKPMQEEEVNIMDVELSRHDIPEPSDKELYLLKVPTFLGFEPRRFDPEDFDIPTVDTSGRTGTTYGTSPYQNAMSRIRWRRSAEDASKLESNARFIKWSDGSLTLQLASSPQDQYVIKANPLAPPQRNPTKPTPTSTNDSKPLRKGNSQDENTFTYLAAPHQIAGLLRITNKFTTGLKVQPLKGVADGALDRLKSSLAAAAGPSGAAEDEGISLVEVTEDPELMKKRAELAERDKQRAARRREAQEMRDRDRTGRVLGRRGIGGSSGLTIGGLEDEEVGSGAGRLPPTGRRQPQRKRRGEILSDDDDGYDRRGRTREDEYDEEDDFLAPSDEEEEVEESDSDEDEGMGDATSSSARKAGKEAPVERDATPKRPREEEEAAAAAAVGLDGSPTSRAKRRRIFEDDDDE